MGSTQFNYMQSYGHQGAAAGYKVGGVWGAVIGGVVGSIGGYIGGGQAERAQKMAKKGAKIERGQSYLDAAVQRRDAIRTIRATRAQSLAAATSEGRGDMPSSMTQGALSSIGAQGNFNIGYFDSRIAHYLLMQKYFDRAGKYARRAEGTFAIMDQALSVVNSMGSMGGMGATGSMMGGAAGGATSGGGGTSMNMGMMG
jgi:hypothetical protein